MRERNEWFELLKCRIIFSEYAWRFYFIFLTLMRERIMKDAILESEIERRGRKWKLNTLKRKVGTIGWRTLTIKGKVLWNWYLFQSIWLQIKIPPPTPKATSTTHLFFCVHLNECEFQLYEKSDQCWMNVSFNSMKRAINVEWMWVSLVWKERSMLMHKFMFIWLLFCFLKLNARTVWHRNRLFSSCNKYQVHVFCAI